MTSSGTRRPSCWFCSAAVSPSRAEVEAVIESRTAAEGGPFRTLTCTACRTRSGALRNRRGEWMLYPLEGATEPTLIDRLVPPTSREHSARARDWWLRNAADVERFRRSGRDPGPAGTAPPPPRPRTTRSRAAATPPAPAAPVGPRAVLGVGPAATVDEVKHAWRAAVKRWHPDRLRTADPVVLAESQRRFQELRDAYESVLAELSR
jgi:DnaJ domain